MPLSAGTRLGPYEIMTPIGAGGMGEVYKARDSRIGRDVAIKLASAEFLDRFDDEIRAVAALNHPNICTLHDVGPNYIVTELVEGETLGGWLMRAPTLERRLDVARQVLEALRAAHHAGFVHRDLKPHNVMVRGDGYVKVLDFGLAKRIPGSGSLTPDGVSATDVTLPGQRVGTISYMSPEQIQGQRVDGRSDLFAFGIMLYEMLVGQHPWRRDSAVDTLHAILHEDVPMDPVGSAAGAEVTAVVHKLLRKHPAERYPSAEAVLEALADHAVARDSDTEAPSRAQPFTSIAVLPFVFLSEIDERKALSLGFADALITILGSLETVTVAPTSAILGYAPGTAPSRVCRDLGVRHTLQGTVQKLGTQWRVSLQLFDAASQRITFSEKHDFRLEDVFEVQDEIGRRVVTSLQRRFPLTMQKSRDRYSSDPEAYNEFMAGLRESYTNTREELQSAARHLARAVELDSECALAHAWSDDRRPGSCRETVARRGETIRRRTADRQFARNAARLPQTIRPRAPVRTPSTRFPEFLRAYAPHLRANRLRICHARRNREGTGVVATQYRHRQSVLALLQDTSPFGEPASGVSLPGSHGCSRTEIHRAADSPVVE
jgi:serine/threonine protein kinase